MPSRYVIVRKFIETYWAAAASAALLAFVFATTDAESLRVAASSFTATGVLAAFAAIVLGTVLACLRYAQVLKALGLQVPLRLAIRANLLGIIGGLVFFQIVGQTLARSAVLARNGVEGPAVLVANIIERITALLWLTALAGIGVVYLFGGGALASLGVQHGFLKFAALLVVALATAAILSCRILRPILRAARTRLLTRASLGVGLLSLLVNQATLLAYVCLTAALAPEQRLIDIAAASAVVMFAASVPISFAGWGVRELSAVFVYQAIGLPAAEALTISVAIGLLNLLAVGLGGLASQWLVAPPHAGLRDTGTLTSLKVGHAIGRISSLGLPLLAAVLVFFNAYIPITGGALNVNLADPVAICGGLIFLFRFHRTGWKAASWRAVGFNPLVLAATLALTGAMLLGLWRFGYTDWAVFSRYVGWYILLAYVATGALIVGDAGEGGRHLLLDTMLVVGTSLCVMEFASTLLQTYGLLVRYLPMAYASGAAQNVNAYGVQLCVLLALLMGYPARDDGVRSWREPALAMVLALVLANVYLAHSRTAYLVSITVVIAACLLRPQRWRTVALATPLAALLVAVATVQISLPFVGGMGGHLIADVSPLLSPRLMHASSDAERMMTIERGVALWRAHPVFGAGLGAFAEEMRQATGSITVIHNTTVWLLAELGLVGAAAMLGLLGSMAVSTWMRARGRTPETPALVLLLVLCAAALFQLPHDVFYQRIFWLVIGATLFAGTFRSLRKATQDNSAHVAALRDVLTNAGATADSAPSHAREEPQWRASKSRSSAFPTRKG